MIDVLDRPVSLAQVNAAIQFQQHNKLLFMYPDVGPLRRALYGKHLEFFAAQSRYREIMFRAGNQIGKSTAGCYADAVHLTGQYPEWWPGRRFAKPVKLWACIEKWQKVREVLQDKLFGSEAAETGQIQRGASTGLIPAHCVGQPRRKTGIRDAMDYIPIQHVSGGWSKLVFKTYEEGFTAFESDVVDVIHFDEEPDDEKIYAGALMRTITTGGLVYMTVTPLHGMTKIQMAFMGANS